MAISNAFTAVGVGSVFSVASEDSASFAITGTFVATLVLEESEHINSGWTSTGLSYTTTQSATTWHNGSSSDKYLRWECTAFTSGTATCTISDVDTVVSDAELVGGKVTSGSGATLAEFRENGIYSGDAGAGDIFCSSATLSSSATVASGVTVTTGDVTASAGDLVATAGDLVATAGDVLATAGQAAIGGALDSTVGLNVLSTGLPVGTQRMVAVRGSTGNSNGDGESLFVFQSELTLADDQWNVVHFDQAQVTNSGTHGNVEIGFLARGKMTGGSVVAYSALADNLSFTADHFINQSGTLPVATGGEVQTDGLVVHNSTEGRTGQLTITTAREVHTLAAAATSDTTLSLPSGSILLGASFNVNETVSDDAGDDTWSAAYVTGSSTALATAAAAAVDTKVDTLVVPEKASAATEIRFTANGGSFDGGVIEVVAYYWSLTSLADV